MLFYPKSKLFNKGKEKGFGIEPLSFALLN